MPADGLIPPVRCYPSITVQRAADALAALRDELLALHPMPAEHEADEPTRRRIGETRQTIMRHLDDARHHAGVAALRARIDGREGA